MFKLPKLIAVLFNPLLVHYKPKTKWGNFVRLPCTNMISSCFVRNMLNRQDKEIEKKSIFLKLKPYSSSRYGFNTPPNYNDHELYCGGYSRQWRTNGGHCGICGDPWDTKQVICSFSIQIV